MRRTLTWIGFGLAGLLGIVVLAALTLYLVGGSRLYHRFDITVAAITVPTDSAASARGRHLAHAITLCAACHGEDLGGSVLFDEPAIATVYASNLTSGQGGLGTYSDADYVRAIRHGVNRDGRGLLIMHSDAYHSLGGADLAAVIAYLKSVPPIDRTVPNVRITPLGSILVALGLFDSESIPLIPAELIDHSAPLPSVPPPDTSAAYGQYLVSIGLCRMCHGPDLRGGPPIEEGAPSGPDIAAYGADGALEEDFATTMRLGLTPDGNPLDPEYMPWKVYSNMTDEELGAIWRYLVMVNGE